VGDPTPERIPANEVHRNEGVSTAWGHDEVVNTHNVWVLDLGRKLKLSLDTNRINALPKDMWQVALERNAIAGLKRGQG
jgi:hypothetical protein